MSSTIDADAAHKKGIAKAKAKCAAKASAAAAAQIGPWPERVELMDQEQLLASVLEPGAQLLVLRAPLRTAAVFSGECVRHIAQDAPPVV